MSDWSEAQDEQGNPYYINNSTGETSWEKPAEMSSGGGNSGGGGGNGGARDEVERLKKELAATKKKLQRAETRLRQSETGGNDKAMEINDLRRVARDAVAKMDRQAGETAYSTTSQFQLLTQFERNARRSLDAIDFMSSSLAVRMDQVLSNKNHVDEAVKKTKKLNDIVANQRARIIALMEELEKVKKELAETKEELRITLERQQEEVEKVARPLRAEILTQMELVAKEKRERKEDREWFAMLWPEGTELPSILQMYYIPDAKQRAEQRKAAELLDLGRAKAEAVRIALAEKNKWSEQEDDFGRVYYENSETQEMVFDMPPAIEYEPPWAAVQASEMAGA